MENEKAKKAAKGMLFLIKRRCNGASAFSTVMLEGKQEHTPRWGSAADFYLHPPIVFGSKRKAEAMREELQALDKAHEYRLREESWRWWL